MGDLPGILTPDAGRLERAARRYAIAVLSAPDVNVDDALSIVFDASGIGDVSTDAYCASFGMAPHQMRLLRARVALYLRWCERVERGEWLARHDRRPGVYSRKRAQSLPPGLWRWARPLWTLAPAHDTAVTAAERRKGKR